MGTTKKTMTNLLATRFLPVTAGTCLLVSIQPSFAAGGHHGLGNGNNPRLHNHPFTMRQQNERISRLNATGLSSVRFDLDLSSLANSVVLGSKMFDGATSVSIDVGGISQTFAPGQSVTPAEYVAIQQVLSNSPQTLSLNAQGGAAGGSFSLNAASQGKVNNLVVPENVAAIDYFSANRVLGFSGDITNSGSIYGVSSNGRFRSGVIAADDISNAGLISTVYGGQKNTDLTLNAASGFSNTGTVSSSGDLSIATVSGAVSNGGTLSAARDLNIVSGQGNVSNSGTMSAGDNLNISTGPAADLNIKGLDGTFSAGHDINIREASYHGINATNLLGGDYLSKNLNVYGGDGSIYADVDELTGKLNTVGGAAHVYASTETLTLGSNCITGDPTYANTTGDIIINGAVVANENITILAAGNVFASGNAYISTANSTGAAATPTTNVTITAGAKVTNTGADTTGVPTPGTDIGAGKQASVDFSAAGVGGLGGNIDFSGSKWTGWLIDTSSNLSGNNNQQQNGGNVILTASAFGGVGGLILFPSGGKSINTASQFNKAGAVSLIAGGISTSTKTPAIRTGIINTASDPASGGADGAVLIMSAQPEATAGTVVTYDEFGAVVGAPNIEINPANLIAGAGAIQFTGNLFAGGAVVTVINTGAGGLTQLNNSRIQGSDVFLTAGTGGIGGGSGKGSQILTQASGNLQLDSGANILLNNLGSVNLDGVVAANAALVDISTTPDTQGNGRITINNNTTIQASAGVLDTVNLTSSEVPGGTGGIRDGGANTNIIATNVNLLEGPTGLGIQDIGTGGNPINTTCINLSANAAANVFLQNAGSVNLLDSSAGNAKTFELSTRPTVANSGQITLLGDISSAFGLIGTINLDSSENAGGTGGIVPGGTLTATTINLSDTKGSSAIFKGDGSAAIGTLAAPITVECTNFSANTLGPTVNIANTISTGMVLNGSQSGLAIGNSFTLTSSSGISVNGGVDSGSTVTLIASGKGKSGLGYIIVGNDITTNVAGGTINLTAGGNITRRGGNALIADIINLTSTGGGAGDDLRPLLVESFGGVNLVLISNCVGYTNIYCDDGSNVILQGTTARNQFTLTGDADVIVNVPITTATGIEIASTNAGNITFSQLLGSSKATGIVEIETDGGNIIGPGLAISAAQTVALSANGGNIGSGAIPIIISAPTFSANTDTAGTVDLSIIGSKKTAQVMLNSSAGGNFNVTSSGSLQLTNLLVEDGSIDVVTTGTLLSTGPNSIIQVGEPATKATAGTITLQNAATKASKSGKSASGIFIGFGTTISTFTNTPGTGPIGSGAINIFTTTAPLPTQVAGTTPTNVQVNKTGGNTFFGTNGITALAGIGTPPTNIMNNKGADITFDTGTRPASAITLGGNVVITADPPILAGTTATQTSQPLNSITPADASLLQPAPRAPEHNLALSSNNTHSTDIVNVNASTTTMNMSVPSATETSAFSQFGNLAGNIATTSSDLMTALRNPVQSRWISETELMGGEIPATVVSDNELGLTTEESAIVELEAEHANLQAPATSVIPGAIVGGVTKNVETVKAFNMKRGAAVFAPNADTVVNTPVGKIKIGAKSLALVMSYGSNISVYDLDDTHKGSIEVTAAGKKIALCPGMHVTISADSVREFSDINPAQMIGYRSINGHHIGDGLKAFTAEFSVPHAITAVQPLKHLLDSKNQHSKRIASHLLKTTAVLMQMGGGRPYEQVFRAQKTAYAR